MTAARKVEAGEPKFPSIKVQLTGEDGNAFIIIGRVRRALRDGGAGPDAEQQFSAEAMAGDYDHVLQTCMKWVTVR